jgi:hypothetical protein
LNLYFSEKPVKGNGTYFSVAVRKSFSLPMAVIGESFAPDDFHWGINKD